MCKTSYDDHLRRFSFFSPPQLFDRRKPDVILACSVISLGSVLQQRSAHNAFASSSEVELTLTKGLHIRLDKQAANRLASQAAIQAPRQVDGMGRGARGASVAGNAASETTGNMSLRDIAEAELLPSKKSVVHIGGGGVAVEGEKLDEYGVFSASGNVLSQADLKVHVGLLAPGMPLGAGSRPDPVDRSRPDPAGDTRPDTDLESDGVVRLTLTIRRLSVLDAAEQLHGIEPVLAQVNNLKDAQALVPGGSGPIRVHLNLYIRGGDPS